MAMHGAPYVATLSPAYTSDFVSKLEKAASLREGFVYLHILSACPTGWRFPPEQSIAVSRLAVETDFFPLWEFENGEFRQTVRIPHVKPVSEFTSSLGKFRHLSHAQIESLQAWVDGQMALMQRLWESRPSQEEPGSE